MADTKKKSGKKNTEQSKNDKAQKPSFAYQLIPYIFAVLALFLLLCFITNAICNPKNILLDEGREGEHALGYVGFWVCQVLFGILGPAAYVVPAILICFVIFWRNYNRRSFVSINAVIAVITSIFAASLIHVFMHLGGGKAAFCYDVELLFDDGARMIGGGVIGGLISYALVHILNIAGTVFVLIAALIPMITFLFGTTPVEITAWIVGKIKAAVADGAEERKAKKEEKALAAKERRDEERRERTKAREEEKQARAAAREAARLEKESLRASESENEARNDGTVELQLPSDGDGNVDNIDVEEKVTLSAFSDEEKRHLDGIKAKAPTEQYASDETVDDDEEGAELVFSRDYNDGGETVVFVDPRDNGHKTRGVDTVDDMASELFDDDSFTVDKETGEVFTPLVNDKKVRSAAEFEAAENPSEERFIGDRPSPAPVAEYNFPPAELLAEGSSRYSSDPAEIERGTEALKGVLRDFRIPVKEITCSCGPTITRYEVKPEAGVRVRQIANLADDIAYGLAKSGIRIEAPIPGKSAVGIEVPNDKTVPVKLRNLLENPEFVNHKSKLAACLGVDVVGKPVVFDIEKMPHLLVAGTTGSGKSVCINSIIMSILYHAKPNEVKLLLIDPKKVEFKVYKDIPHLCCRIVSDPKKAAGALNTAVNEMEKRFELIEEVGVRNITGYNEATKNDPDKPYMPRMVIIIDEFADLMMTAKDEVETAVVRIAQKARAAGIHLIVGTQRPSVDVITGLIKANIPSRIAFTVMSGVDSRTIIDTVGAEKLCGRGDMLYAPVGSAKPQRVQGTFVSDEEVESVVEYVKSHNAPVMYDQEFESSIDVEAGKCGNAPERSGSELSSGGSGDEDAKFWDAVELAVDCGKISTSLLQRRLEVGYGRAAKIIDRMEEMGFVSAPDGNKPRKILISKDELDEKRLNSDS